MAKPGTAVMVKDQQGKSILDYLQKQKRQIEAALPKHMSADRMARIALTEIRRNPKLMQCDPLSLFAAVIQASQLGLEPGLLGECYLIPYGREAKLQPGYQGLVKLARNSDQILSFVSQVVYEKDVFEFEYGIDEKLRHIPSSEQDRGKKIRAYAIAKFKGGGYQFEVMTSGEILNIRDRYSKTYQDYMKNPRYPDGNPKPEPTWLTNEDAMFRKTVTIQLCKWLPKSPELSRAIELDHGVEAEERQGLKGEIFQLDEDDDIYDVAEEMFWTKVATVNIGREDPAMTVYLEETAKFFKISVPEVMDRYAKDDDAMSKFLTAFDQRQKQNKSTHKRSPKPKSEPLDAGAQPATEPDTAAPNAYENQDQIECPDHPEGAKGDMMFVESCKERCAKSGTCLALKDYFEG
jgi:recombination protein RecT